MWNGDQKRDPCKLRPGASTDWLFVREASGSDKWPDVFCRRYEDEAGPKDWTDVRYEHVMKLRQVALESAREMWADYFMVGQQTLSSQSSQSLLFYYTSRLFNIQDQRWLSEFVVSWCHWLTCACSWQTVTISSPILMSSGCSWKKIRPSSLPCWNLVQPIQTFGAGCLHRCCNDFISLYLWFECSRQDVT